jgi:hypothetical protein
MSNDQDQGKESILIKVTPPEAMKGAVEDLYRPLTKEEAHHKANLKSLLLMLLLGLPLIGIVIEMVRLYARGGNRNSLLAEVGYVPITTALSGIMAWTLSRIVLRGFRQSDRVRRVLTMLLWVVLFFLGLFSSQKIFFR